MQAIQDAGAYGATPSDAANAEGVLLDPDDMTWLRRDWPVPVGTFSKFTVEEHRTEVEGHLLHWWAFEVGALHLGHRAAMYLLQGLSLSNLLLPSHYIQRADGTFYGEVGQLVLRVDPWNYRLPRPVVTGLIVVTVEPPPQDFAPEKVLEVLVAATAA